MTYARFTVAYWCLLAGALLPIVCAGIAKWGTMTTPANKGGFDNNNPRAWLARQTDWRARANAYCLRHDVRGRHGQKSHRDLVSGITGQYRHSFSRLPVTSGNHKTFRTNPHGMIPMRLFLLTDILALKL